MPEQRPEGSGGSIEFCKETLRHVALRPTGQRHSQDTAFGMVISFCPANTPIDGVRENNFD